MARVGMPFTHRNADDHRASGGAYVNRQSRRWRAVVLSLAWANVWKVYSAGKHVHSSVR